jgi:hypothetical protein
MFIIHNPLLLSMHDAQIASITGPMMGGGKQDLRELFATIGLDACERMLHHPDLVVAAAKFDALDEANYDVIKPGQDITFITGARVSGNFRAVFAVAVLYRFKIRNTTLWKRTTCSEFQTVEDSEERVHLIPYISLKNSN